MIFRTLAVSLRQRALAARVALKARLGILGPLSILAYRGYATDRETVLKGRVVEHKRIPEARGGDSLLDALRATLRRLTRLPIPGARIRVTFKERVTEVATNDEGFFDLRFPFSPPDHPEEGLWHPLRLELIAPRPQGRSSSTEGSVLHPPRGCRHIVISDIDDTVVPTEATSFLRMLRSLFLGSARSRLPFPGVAAFYRALHVGRDDQPLNPILYVSRGPWNLYDLLCEFFRLHQIPIGPVLFLREWGVSDEGLRPAAPRGHKFRLIEGMLRAYAELPFILVGDSGQLDPEIYAEVVDEHPDRVQAVYIRVAEQDPERLEGIRRLADRVAKAGSRLVLAHDTEQMARHASECGFIEERHLAEIGVEKAVAEEPPGILETTQQ